MTVSEFTPLLKQQLNDLSDDRAIDFALDICRRLLPEYINFAHRNNWGDPETIIDAISFCTQNKTFQTIEIDKAKELRKAVESVIPDMDDFGDYDSSYALNASCAVLELLEFMLDGDKSHILNISTYMTDTVDFKISEAEPDLTNEQLENHERLAKELNYQLDLIKNNVA